MRADAIAIFAAALRAVEPGEAVRRHLVRQRDLLKAGGESDDLSRCRRIALVGAGKAAAVMSAAVEEILGDRLDEGLVVTKYGHVAPLKRVRLHEAGHPVPDEAGLKGARAILEIATRAGPEDLILCVLSGGASALLPAPAAGIRLQEKQEMTRRLLECGATIDEMNAVRKHISVIKGGQLARAAYPAAFVSLILSDVIGDRLDVIASGPTAADPSTFQDAHGVLRKYELTARVPASMQTRIERGTRGEVPETPKPGDPIFDRVRNVIIGNNRRALEAAREEAERRGYHATILSHSIQGEARAAAAAQAAIAREIVRHGRPVPRPACVIAGGETTVTVRGQGLGGRNQEFALAAALDIQGLEGVLILSGATDGTDGRTDAAGAVCDGETVPRARRLGLAPEAFLADNDSYRFFEALGDLLTTGPTNTNVMDLQLVLVS
ncbi:MAG: glycerate kinase [Gemmatimonadetes bacterium]|nr:glycerate kinase [Gemmatimonadota bacterium]